MPLLEESKMTFSSWRQACNKHANRDYQFTDSNGLRVVYIGSEDSISKEYRLALWHLTDYKVRCADFYTVWLIPITGGK